MELRIIQRAALSPFDAPPRRRRASFAEAGTQTELRNEESSTQTTSREAGGQEGCGTQTAWEEEEQVIAPPISSYEPSSSSMAIKADLAWAEEEPRDDDQAGGRDQLPVLFSRSDSAEAAAARPEEQLHAAFDELLASPAPPEEAGGGSACFSAAGALEDAAPRLLPPREPQRRRTKGRQVVWVHNTLAEEDQGVDAGVYALLPQEPQEEREIALASHPIPSTPPPCL